MAATQAQEGRSNLALRIASALVLAPLAIAAAYFGGWPFALFWTLAALAVLWEWIALVGGADSKLAFFAGAIAIVAAIASFEIHYSAAAMLIILLGAIAAGIFTAKEQRIWTGAGVVYAGAMVIAPLALRFDPQYGLIAVLMLYAVVWVTDIFGYFGGRIFGGPKLAPRISPKKTWSGAICGTAGAAGTALALGYAFGLAAWVWIFAIAILLSVLAQIGDLLESRMKRYFNAKDAGTLIPGHGGVMDRLDGFWMAAFAGAVIGIAREGVEASARGLLVW